MTQQQGNDMQLAEILSDLVSLRPGVCDPAAARALVSIRPSASASSNPTTVSNALTTAANDTYVGADDADLKRAKELLSLHYEVRERCKSGELSRDLAEARKDVDRAIGG